MDAESRWENRMEWAEERRRGDDIEINKTRPVTGDWQCEARYCTKTGTVEVEVKRVDERKGTWVVLCAEHNNDETPHELYRGRI